MKTVTNSEYCFESRIRISVSSFSFPRSVYFSNINLSRSALHVGKICLNVRVIGGFRNNFQDHRRIFLSHSRLSESRNKLPGEGFRKFFGISECFYRVSINFIFEVLYKKNIQQFSRPSALIQQVFIWFSRPSKK
jgi:hypothetical protein